MKKRSFIFLFVALLAGCNPTINSSISSSFSNSTSSNGSINATSSSSSSSSDSKNHTSSSNSNSSSSTNTSFSSNSISSISYSEYEGNYYDGINESKTGLALRSEIAALITETHKTFTSYNELSEVYRVADADPDKPGNIIWFYSGTSIKYNGLGGSVGDTNREHVWPKDGGKAFPEKSGPGSDGHHLRPTECQMNSTRGSLSFDEVEQTASNIVKQDGSTSYGNLCYKSGSFFYPGKGYRGATARILMYVQTRWGDQYNLKFVDSAGKTKTIGKISTLMKWHLTEPVTEEEIRRNEAVFQMQGNRNPFIDHPEYATKIYCNDGESYNQALKNVVNQYGDYSATKKLPLNNGISNALTNYFFENKRCLY